MRCKHVYDDGSRCRSPENFVDPNTGFCHAHGPDASERLSEYGKKGAEAKNRKDRIPGLDDDELPPLDSPQAAAKWCEVAGRAVATGRLGHHEAKAVVRAVREFLRSHEAGEVADRVEELQEKVARLKGGDLKALK